MGRNRRLFRLPSSEAGVGSEVEEEIAFHVEERTRELVARGMDGDAARKEALREFGDVGEARSELETIGKRRVRQVRRSNWWSDLRQDLRFGARASVRAPLFTALAVVTLALGIGANAAIFSVVKSVLLNPLPYHEGDRLVRFYGRTLDGTQERGGMSAGTISDVRERQRSFESLAAFIAYPNDGVLGTDEGARVIGMGWVEPELFRTLGVAPALGRPFHPEDAQDTARVVLLTHLTWQGMFGGAGDIVGSEIVVNGITRTVAGVLPRHFVGPVGEVDIYFPFTIAPILADPVSGRRSHFMGMLGRLSPGITHEAASREATAIGVALASEHPADQGSMGLTAMPLREAMAGEMRTPLIVLLLGAGLVLLIACANLAGAFLSRTISRRKEFAVRVAMGAARGRVVRQLLTESTMLALIGGVAGLALAWLALGALRGMEIPAIPPYAELRLDGGAIAVTAAIAFLTGLVFGLAPALSVGRSAPSATLRDETRGSSESRRSRRMRGALVAGQIALCVSLLVGAGLLARSMWAMTSAPLGFEPAGVLSAYVQLPFGTYDSLEQRERFREEFSARLLALPGVTEVASASDAVPSFQQSLSFLIEGRPEPEGGEPFVTTMTVSDEWFRLMRLPLRQGRTFGPEDHEQAQPVLVISETMARRHWPAGDAIGARLQMGPDHESPRLEVVGIVGDVRIDLAATEAEPIAFLSTRQRAWHHPYFLLRAQGDPLALARAAEVELAALDAGLPLHRVRMLDEVLSQGVVMRRLPMILMIAFGVLALLLASGGVYAMFASMVAAREREFGVRMALGSQPRSIAGLVLGQGATWMAVGLVLGAAGVVLVGRMLRDLLYGVAPLDPVTILVTVGVLLVCGAVALLAPVRRATRVDPATALRS